MGKVDDGEEKEKEKKQKNGVFSGHYVIASSLPPERRPLERRTLVPKVSAAVRFGGIKKPTGYIQTHAPEDGRIYIF